MIGLCGAHRTGKSTLARAVAEQLGMPYVQADLSGVFEEAGLSAKDELPFALRLAVQNVLLNRLHEAYRAAPMKAWISDRTPLDVLLYTWAEVGRNSVAPELNTVFEQHLVRAYELTNRYFTQVWNVQPGIELVEAPGKAPLNKAYIEHLNMLFEPVAQNPLNQVMCYRIPRSLTELHLRVQLVSSYVVDTLTTTHTRKLAA